MNLYEGDKCYIVCVDLAGVVKGEIDLQVHGQSLTLRGNRRPLPQLAGEFGLSRSQARDRIYKARQRQYLTGGNQGRAGAGIGPRLKELGWNPPQPDSNATTLVS